ncbi:hypothetical protein [Mycolicibacterium brisbanense]
MVDEQRPGPAAGSGPPNPETNDDVTVEAGKKYFLLVFTFAVLLWIVGWGVHRQWWTLPLPALGVTVLGIVVGVVSKYEEKRLKAARFTRRAHAVTACYVGVLAVAALTVWLWGSPMVTRIGAAFRHGESSAPTSAGPASPGQPPDSGQPAASNCQDPPVSFPTPWGPDRSLISDQPLTTAGPFSSQPTFNNAIFKGAPGEPDEDMRSRLVTARPSVLNNPGGFLTDLPAVPDEEYRVRIVVDNNGSPAIAGTAALDSRVRLVLPQCPTNTVRIVGVATSSNAVPSTVWATTTFTADRPFRLVPSGREAKICPKMECVSNSDFTTFTGESDLYGPQGALLGTNPAAPDGVLPGLTGVDILFYVKAVF